MVTVPVGKLPDTYGEYDAAGFGNRLHRFWRYLIDRPLI